MAVVFILGPGMWDPEKRTPSDPAPLQVRRDIAKDLRGHGHDVVLMEDDVDREGEDLIDKFDHPDDLVIDTIDLSPGGVAKVIAEQAAALKNPPRATPELLDTLCDQGVVRTVAKLP
jgi:hypothetical protein